MKWFGGKPKTGGAQADSDRALGFDDFEVKLGDLMRGERATLGKSLLDVQRELHIRATYIAAIESGDLSAFEAASFVAGYVRSYARYLGMDPDWSYAKFCVETGFAINTEIQRGPGTPVVRDVAVNREFSQGMLSRTRMASDPDPIWSRLDPVAIGSVAVMLFLIIGVSVGGWTVLREVQRVNISPPDLPPEIMADLDPVLSGAATRSVDVDDMTLRLSEGTARSSQSSGAQGIVRTHRPEALETPVFTSRDGPIVAINPRGDNVDDTDSTIRAAIDAALAQTDAPLPDLGTVRVTESGPARVEVLAVRPSWIRVRDASGTVLFEKVLDAGERYAVPQSDAPATLRAGNSGSVYILVDGQPFGPSAPGAQVVDQIALSPESVTERFAEADLSGDSALREFVNVAQADN